MTLLLLNRHHSVYIGVERLHLIDIQTCTVAQKNANSLDNRNDCSDPARSICTMMLSSRGENIYSLNVIKILDKLQNTRK